MSTTYAQSRAEMIEAFRPHAQRFAELIRNRHIQSYTGNHTNIKRYHPTKMDFSYLADNFPIHHVEFTTSEIPGGQEGIKFWFNQWCFVAFYNIRERAGAKPDVTRGPVEVVGANTRGVDKIPLRNTTDDVQPARQRFEKVAASGRTTDIGAKASAAFRQMFKAGGEAASFSSETEITLAVESSINQQNWHSDTLADEFEWDGEVPPHTIRTLERSIEVGKSRQMVTVDGELDYSVYILSRGDFDIVFDSRDDVAAVLAGVGNTGKGGHYSDWARAYSLWPLDGAAWWADEVAGPVMARYVDYDESDQASNKPVTWSDEPLGVS